MYARQQLFGMVIISSFENNSPSQKLCATPNSFAHNRTSSFFHYPTKPWSCRGAKLKLGKLETLPRLENFEISKSLRYTVETWKVMFAKFISHREKM